MESDSDLEHIFTFMILEYLKKHDILNDDDDLEYNLEEEISRMSYAIANTFWYDEKVKNRIYSLVYGGDEDIVDNEEENYSYRYLVLQAIQESIENKIKKIVFNEILKSTAFKNVIK